MKMSGKDSPGLGRILCGACGLPTRDHKIGPCRMWDRDVAPLLVRTVGKKRRKR